jgi:hypothetical protein
LNKWLPALEAFLRFFTFTYSNESSDLLTNAVRVHREMEVEPFSFSVLTVDVHEWSSSCFCCFASSKEDQHPLWRNPEPVKGFSKNKDSSKAERHLDFASQHAA